MTKVGIIPRPRVWADVTRDGPWGWWECRSNTQTRPSARDDARTFVRVPTNDVGGDAHVHSGKRSGSQKGETGRSARFENVEG